MVVRRKVKTAVQDHVDELRQDGHLDSQGEALAVLALNLAGLLDAGEPPTMTAAWARELRATLAALRPEGGSGDGDPDAWLDSLTAGSAAEVRHTEEP